MTKNKIGVIGAGVMGQGVSLAFLEKGFEVILIDLEDSILEKALMEMESNFRMSLFFRKNPPQDSFEQISAALHCSTNIEDLKDCTFIIENASENWEIKKEIFTQLNSFVEDTQIIFANTSCISITKLSALLTIKSNLIGVHFMNPVSLKSTLEIIKGYHTSEKTIKETEALLRMIDKEMILVQDAPGFVANRISHLFMNEAAFVVQDQIAKPEDVDNIFKKCYEHKMGPLETADLIGLDTVVNSLDVLYQDFQDPKFRCCPLLRKMVDANLLGRKSGEGFYKY